jgi:uncharacterized membrane protein YoaK (UPF0700 family)
MKLGALTGFTAGMVNVSSLILFFSFTSNITGHFAILADEISKGKWTQILVVFIWIFLYFAGSFLSNNIIINAKTKNLFWAHVTPLLLEIVCFLIVGIYGNYFYEETLVETELLTALLLFSMGIQNGLTASISNFAVKSTHLTGLVTDLGIYLSMLTNKSHRKNPIVKEKLSLLSIIMIAYLSGGILAGFVSHLVQFDVFYYISLMMMTIIIWDYIFVKQHSKVNKIQVNVDSEFQTSGQLSA